MNWRQSQSARAAALQLSLAIVTICASTILFATSLATAPKPIVAEPTATPPPGPLIVSLPVYNLNPVIPIEALIFLPVTTANIVPSLGYIGFQGDFTFDETVCTFVSPFVDGAGLTANGWTVAGNILPGSGPIRTLRVSAFVNDTITPLAGFGTLYHLIFLRVSTTPPANTLLAWRAAPDNFVFIDSNLNTIAPLQTNGVITVCNPSEACPTPTPTPGVGCGTFANSATITIPASWTGGFASPYPSNITVSGLGGAITKVTVAMNGIAHTAPADIDVLLVGPTGQNAIIMSDVGGYAAVDSVTLVLDDAAANSLPKCNPFFCPGGGLISGTFRPTNNQECGDGNGPIDTFPAPAPSPRGGSPLSLFEGTDPNGTWSLYVVDDEDSQHAGVFSDGWAITISTDNCNGPEPTPNPNPTPTPTPGPTHFRIQAPSFLPIPAPITFTVTALDASNSTVDYLGTLHFTSSNPFAQLPPDSSLTNGIGTFTASFGEIFIGHTVTATDTVNFHLTGTSNCVALGDMTPTPPPPPTPSPSPAPLPTGTPLPTPCGVTFSENFDGVTAPSLPTGWTTAAASGISPWQTSTENAPSAPNDAVTYESSAGGETVLETPAIAVPAEGGILSFQNHFNLLGNTGPPPGGQATNGMVLDIRINAGSYDDIIGAGGTFLDGGYTHTIGCCVGGNPLTGRMAWSGFSGNSASYITSTIRLPSTANGQTIKLKWRVGTIAFPVGGIPPSGEVRIDSIVITPAICPTPTPCPVGFGNAPDVGVGNSPMSLAIADFNSDGKQDLAVANFDSDTVSIRLGDGLGGFSGSTEVSVGFGPRSIAIGDFNGDGKQDLAVANFVSSTVSIRLGNGLGGFSASSTVNVGGSPIALAIGDFNGDGKQDLAVVNWSAQIVMVFLGNGFGGFGGPTNVSTGAPRSVAIGDFNGDSKQDLAVANWSLSTVAIRLGDGLGGFSGSTAIGVGDTPISVAIGDFNGNSNQDLAVANFGTNTVSIRLGDGLGGFSGSTTVTVGDGPGAVAIGDFDGDGKQDLAVANDGPSDAGTTVSIRLGDGLGGFSGSTSVSVGSGPRSVATGDFNGDGKKDLAVANFVSNTVSIRLGQCTAPTPTPTPCPACTPTPTPTPGTPTPTPTPPSIDHITLLSRLSDARAYAHRQGGTDAPPPQIQTDFLPANLSNSASTTPVPGGTPMGGGYGAAHSTSNSVIVADKGLGTLRVTGNGHADAGAATTDGDAEGSAKLIVLGFAVTDAPFYYSLTGELSSWGCSSEACGMATAKLTEGSSTIFEVSAPPDATLSQTGTLPPGTYTLSVEVIAWAAPFISSSANVDANFAFALDPAPTPTATPTPTSTATPGEIHVSISPSMHDFGSVMVGSSSDEMEFVVNCSAFGGCFVNSVSVVDTANFSITSTTCGPQTPGSGPDQFNSCVVNVKFDPLTAGLKLTSLRATIVCTCSPNQASADLRGMGIASPTPTPCPACTPTPTPTVSPTPSAGETHAQNLSTRLFVQTGANVGIGGFIITGSSPKEVVLRGIGPSLGNFGVPNPLVDPVLELHDSSGTLLMRNDNWCDTPWGCPPMGGLAPNDALESAILATLDPGAYTVILGGNNNGTGVGLVEMYHVSPGSSSKLANISTRGSVGTGTDIVIAGFILGGGMTDDVVLLRGIGPSLALGGVTNALANPTLELRDSDGAVVVMNDDWQSGPQVSLPPNDPLESAIEITLSPGAYTALLSGVNNGTGVGLVEVYDLGLP